MNLRRCNTVLWGQSTNFRWIGLFLLSPVCSFKNELAPTLKTKN